MIPALKQIPKDLMVVFLQFLLLGLMIACNTQKSPIQEENQTTLQAEKKPDQCVQSFDPKKDYFPEKIQPSYAEGFTVSYHNHYKIVVVKQPWETATENLTYILVQCGTPIPEQDGEATVVMIPPERVLAMSTTYLPHLERLNVLEKLVGVSDRRLIYSPIIREKIAAGTITEVGDLQPDAEKILSLQPDLILSYRLDAGESSRLNTLKSLGETIVLDAAHLEANPLGRAEWLKFTALLFNQEEIANEEFAAIANRYQTLQAQTQSLTDLPTVFSGSPFQGAWYVPGGDSYFAQFFVDAGADYLWKNTDSRLSLSLDFEAVLEMAREANFWVNPNQAWQTKADLRREDQRYELFLASQTNQVFIPNARLNPEGGNDFWESGTVNPDIILADLIKIFHPELLPNHQLYYYRQLQ